MSHKKTRYWEFKRFSRYIKFEDKIEISVSFFIFPPFRIIVQLIPSNWSFKSIIMHSCWMTKKLNKIKYRSTNLDFIHDWLLYECTLSLSAIIIQFWDPSPLYSNYYILWSINNSFHKLIRYRQLLLFLIITDFL